ncbi:MAG: protein-glutamate O-methyltransferase CheR [Myxococcaceae bacterium]|nr:protein-glutamate O-methyltransferase CheR [Myxococcaceae bacterium]
MEGLPDIRQSDFEVVREAVKSVTGISLSDAKRSLVQTRLAKRLRHLGLTDFGEYVQYLRDHAGAEREALIASMTTHTTHFWREGHHFDDLARLVLKPAAQRRPGALRLWCAASSTGEEPYCLAMTVAAHLDVAAWDVKILATDIDVGVLQEAERAEYAAEDADIRPEFSHCFEPAPGAAAERVRVRQHLRALVRFRRLNLIDTSWPMRHGFDAIFVRNILIYFDGPTQQSIVQRMVGHLRPNGVLVLGHAESMLGVRAELEPIGRGVFRRRHAWATNST